MGIKVYLAGPMTGISPEEQEARDHQTIDMIEGAFEETEEFGSPINFRFFSPRRGKNSTLSSEGKYQANHGRDERLDRYIYGRDQRDVRTCDVIFANLLGATTVSIGTVSEIAWANLLDKLLIVVMEPGNPHEHTFILQSTPFVYSTLEEAVNELSIILQ